MADGAELTVTTTERLQPWELVTITLVVPAARPDTEVDHARDVPTVATVTFELLQVPPSDEDVMVVELPAHILAKPDKIPGREYTTTDLLLLQPVRGAV
jgi:hypothetical protein